MLQKLLIFVNLGVTVYCQVCFPGEPCGGENKGTGDFGDYFDVKDNIPTEKIITTPTPRASCQTIAGIDCVFPFKYNDITYNGCITIKDPENKPWCSTKVDPATKIHISGTGDWGHCNPNCPSGRNLNQVEEAIEDIPDEPCKTIFGDDGICQAASTCALFESDDAALTNCTNLSFICCKQRTGHAPSILTRFAGLNDVESFDKPEQFSVEKVENTLQSIKFGFSEAVEAEEDEEVDLQNEDISPHALHLAFNRPRQDVFRVDQSARTLEKVKQTLQNDIGSNEIGTRFFNTETSERINNECSWTPAPSCERFKKEKFRSIDGSCNNFEKPNYGRAATPFQRIIESEYAPGTVAGPRIAKNGFDLPSARKLSTTVTKTSANQDRRDGVSTVLVMQMGQFIDHDITHTPNHAKKCCNKDGSFPSSFDSNKCFPIEVPADDPFWTGRLRCMDLARSLSSPNLKCEIDTRQQMNQITHWLDASNIYGSSDFENQPLRKRVGGLLKITATKGSKTGLLPTCDRESKRDDISMCSGCKSCFFAGDVRANEQLNLIAMHTIWMREHNRVARNLLFNNPAWLDDRLYEEARRIVIAEYQHIIFNEWLPLIVGTDLMQKFGLFPLTSGHSDLYLDTFDPRVSNEFATAAFRFGHSLIPSTFSKIAGTGARSGSSGSLNMKDIFFKPREFMVNRALMDDMIRGMVSQKGDKWDNSFSQDITNHLFESSKGTGGLDLVAMNIQRGRDHGLPGYNAYREICQIGRARNFDDLLDYMTPDDVERLKSLYSDVDDIDLYVGGFLERRHTDSILGPVFKCIIADTFARLKIGDRFFYDLGLDQRTMFSTKQLREIRKVSMARVICDNSEGIDEIQPQAFRASDTSRLNIKVSCQDFNKIPRIDITKFSQGL